MPARKKTTKKRTEDSPSVLYLALVFTGLCLVFLGIAVGLYY